MSDATWHVVEPLAIVRDYAGLRSAIISRRRELGFSQEEVNEIAGLQGGYINKIEAGMKAFGPMSLEATFAALGMKLALIRCEPHATALASLPSRETVANRQRKWAAADARCAARRRRLKPDENPATEAF